MRELDPGVLVERLERLGLDQRDVAAAEVAVTGKAPVRHVHAVDRLRELLVLGGNPDRLYLSSHGDQSTLPRAMSILEEVVERYLRDLRPSAPR